MVARAVITLVLVTVLIGYTLIAAYNVQQQLIAYGIIKKTETQNPLANVLEGIRRTASIAGPAFAIATITAAATLTVIRSRRILGIIPFMDVQRHLLLLGPTGAGKTTIAKKVIEMAIKRDVRVTRLEGGVR